MRKRDVRESILIRKSYSFCALLGVLRESVWEEDLWGLLYSEALMILASTTEEEIQRVVKALERKGFKLNAKQTEVTICIREVRVDAYYI